MPCIYIVKRKEEKYGIVDTCRAPKERIKKKMDLFFGIKDLKNKELKKTPVR